MKPLVIILSLLAHSSATFDAASTCRVVRAGTGRELNPEYAWASHSPAMYAAIQDKAVIADVLFSLARRRQSPRLRTIAIWLAAGTTAVHLVAGANNMRLARRGLQAERNMPWR